MAGWNLRLIGEFFKVVAGPSGDVFYIREGGPRSVGEEMNTVIPPDGVAGWWRIG